MNEQQIKQALQEIAQENIPSHTDLWPVIKQKVKRPLRWTGWQWGMQLAGAGLALAALALFLLWLPSLSQVATQPPAALTSPVAPTDNALASWKVTTTATLVFPAAPETLPRYQVTIVSPPDSPEEALHWAAEFGLPDAKLFRDPRRRETLIVLGSDGSRLSFHETDHLLAPIGYSPGDWLEVPEGETIAFVAAADAAEAFLAAHNLLPQPYQVRDVLSRMRMADGYPPRQLLVTPDLAGHALYAPDGTAIGAALLIDPQGEVFWGGFLPAEIKETGLVSVRPAEDVAADFINGRLAPIQLDTAPAFTGQPGPTRYYPPLPTHKVGQTVTILETGDTHFLVAEDGSEIRATLRTGTGAKYELSTPDLAEIVEQIEYNELRVTGTIVAQAAPDTWQLAVELWEILPQQAFTFSGCAVGLVEINEDGAAWVVAEAVMGRLARNGRYRIPNLPPAIHNGDRIEICNEPRLEPSQELAWQVIYAPPRWELYENGGLKQPEAIELAASPYQIGETAVLTGVVTADVYPTSEDGTVSLWLIADLPGSEIGHIYPLVGDETQLQAVAADFSGQPVQMTGMITTTTNALDGQQALAVSAVSQPWPQPPDSDYAERVLLALSKMELDELQTEFAELQAAQNALVIEEMELAYYFDPNGDSDTAVPVWLAQGHSQNGQNHFLAYLPAGE